jgi:hypothetical protein
MHTIMFSDTEQTLLIELLTNDLIELRREIQHTDNHNYRSPNSVVPSASTS